MKWKGKKASTASDRFVSVIIAAGGKGRRMGADINKIFLDLDDAPVLAHTLAAFDTCEAVDEIIIATSEDDMLGCHDIVNEFQFSKVKTITRGGTERSDSVCNGLKEVSPEAAIVLVHDAARPLIQGEAILAVIEAAQEVGAAVLGVPSKSTIKRTDEGGFIKETLNRDLIWEAQTPQGFRKKILEDAYAVAAGAERKATDDSCLVEWLGLPVKMVRGAYDNLKITTYEDLLTAESILSRDEEAPIIKI